MADDGARTLLAAANRAAQLQALALVRASRDPAAGHRKTPLELSGGALSIADRIEIRRRAEPWRRAFAQSDDHSLDTAERRLLRDGDPFRELTTLGATRQESSAGDQAVAATPSEQRPSWVVVSDPLARFAGVLPAGNVARINVRALGWGERAARLSDEDLAAHHSEATRELRSKPRLHDRYRWWIERHGRAAVRIEALARLEAMAEPGADRALPLDRWRAVLPEADVTRIDEVAQKTCEWAQGLDERGREKWKAAARSRDPFSVLAGIVDRWSKAKERAAATLVCVQRERYRRDLLTAIEAEIQTLGDREAAVETVTIPRDESSFFRDPVSPMDRFANAKGDLLGDRRIASILNMAVAIQQRLSGKGLGLLSLMRRQCGEPLAALDAQDVDRWMIDNGFAVACQLAAEQEIADQLYAASREGDQTVAPTHRSEFVPVERVAAPTEAGPGMEM